VRQKERAARRRLVVAAQVEFESEIEAKLKAASHVLVSSGWFQAVSTWVS
jgi:hypothetical protein